MAKAKSDLLSLGQGEKLMNWLNASADFQGATKGEDDPAIPEEIVERTAQAIREAGLKTLPGEGHFPMVEFDGFADLVADFLNRHGL